MVSSREILTIEAPRSLKYLGTNYSTHFMSKHFEPQDEFETTFPSSARHPNLFSKQTHSSTPPPAAGSYKTFPVNIFNRLKMDPHAIYNVGKWYFPHYELQ